MRREDVDEMAKWPYHLDPFFSRGVRLPATTSGRNRWWNEQNREPFATLLAADDQAGRLIGRVSVTVVDEKAREGVMGVRIRPELENKGYGTDLLTAFLEYWFFQRDMEIITFDANILNQRAIACYRKVGVPEVGYHYEYQPHYFGEEGMHGSGFLKFLDFRLTRDQYLNLLKQRKTGERLPV